MFQTLRYDVQNDDGKLIHHDAGQSLQRSSACKRCRARKQRCSGRRDGCDRCRQAAEPCLYPSACKGKDSKRRKRPDAQSRQHDITSLTDTSTPLTNFSGEKGQPRKNRKFSGQEFRSAQPFSPLTPSSDGTIDKPHMVNLAAGSLGDDFAFPDDFLQSFLPTDDLQGLGGYPDLDLDTYFLNDLSSDELVPSSLDFDVTETYPSGIQSYPTPSSMGPVGAIPSTGSSDPVDGLEQTALLSSNGLSLKASDRSETREASTCEASCQCLLTIGTMLVELEAKSLVAESGTLDSMLASQKDFLSWCNSILDCGNCSMRAEYILVLGLLAQNLTNLCEATVEKYLDEVRRRSNTLGTPSTTISSPPISEANNKVYLGQYEVASPQEWHTLMKVLIVMQLQNVQSLLRGMFRAASLGSNAKHFPMIERPCPTERRVTILIQRLGQAT